MPFTKYLRTILKDLRSDFATFTFAIIHDITDWILWFYGRVSKIYSSSFESTEDRKYKDNFFKALHTQNIGLMRYLFRTRDLPVIRCRVDFCLNSLHLHKVILEHDTLTEKRREKNLKVGAFLIEKGYDINTQDEHGYTPLYLACFTGLSDWIHLLLFHGADPLICCERGILPIAALNAFKYDEFTFRVLFDYTFNENEKIPVKLGTIVNSMEIETNKINSYPNIIKHVSNITYDEKDLNYFYHAIPTMIPECFKLFKIDFKHIVKDMINCSDILFFCFDFILCRADSDDSGTSDSSANNLFSNHIFEILEIIVDDDDLVFDLVQKSKTTLPIIHYITCVFNILNKNLHELTNFVCILLTHGLHVTSLDVETIYLKYGFCELFRILLHMDVKFARDLRVRSVMLMLYFNVNLTLEDILRENRCHLYVFMDFKNVIDYFCNYKIKDIALSMCNAPQKSKVVEKINKMPNVPSLLELSRNVARKFIIKKYEIKELKQFYRVLNELSIGRCYTQILSYEVKLYNY